jgi:hypothetical protein
LGSSFCKKVNNVFNFQSRLSKLVSTRRSTVLSLTLQLVFPGFCHRHLMLVDCLRAWPVCFICLVSSVSGCSKHIGSYSGHIYSPSLLASLALSAHLPFQLICLVSPPALSAPLPCQPICLVSLLVLSARVYRHHLKNRLLNGMYYCLPCLSS